jgi:pyruvate kinase
MAAEIRRTKIVATLGPATRDPAVLRELVAAGADVLRLNFSHGSPDEHAETAARARRASQETGREVGLLGDLPGPKLRVGEIDGDVVELEAGERFVLTTESALGSAERVTVSWAGLTESMKPGDEVFLADGSIRLQVTSVSGPDVICEIDQGGPLSSHKGLNLPGAEIGLPSVSATDLAWVDFATEHGFDLLAVSFVRRPEDLEPVDRRLKERGSTIPLIAKIEKPQAAENAEDIIRAVTAGIMVARGDLGIELPLSRVPVLQKRLIALAGRHSRPSITATQMLSSMVRSRIPTRAEVTDVANAIYDGTDAVMLSEETAVGAHPVEAVRVMDRIARETETDLPYGEWLLNRVAHAEGDVASSVAYGAVAATYRLGLAALCVPTNSGRTARLVSAHRPQVPVLAISPDPGTVRRLNLLFGVTSVPGPPREELGDLLTDCARLARESGVARSGELVAITAGLPEQELGTNLFEVHRVP